MGTQFTRVQVDRSVAAVEDLRVGVEIFVVDNDAGNRSCGLDYGCAGVHRLGTDTGLEESIFVVVCLAGEYEQLLAHPLRYLGNQGVAVVEVPTPPCPTTHCCHSLTQRTWPFARSMNRWAFPASVTRYPSGRWRSWPPVVVLWAQYDGNARRQLPQVGAELDELGIRQHFERVEVVTVDQVIGDVLAL